MPVALSLVENASYMKTGMNVFFRSSAVLLLLAAIAKVYSAGGAARILSFSDLLLHMNNRLLMLGVGGIEAAVAVYLLRSRLNLMRAVVVLWLSSNFIVYRFTNYFLGIKTCPCLGTLGERLAISQAHVNMLLTGLVLYWFFGSSYILWRAWTDEQERHVMAKFQTGEASAS